MRTRTEQNRKIHNQQSFKVVEKLRKKHMRDSLNETIHIDLNVSPTPNIFDLLIHFFKHFSYQHLRIK